jgi:hypothetical protein
VQQLDRVDFGGVARSQERSAQSERLAAHVEALTARVVKQEERIV